MTAAHIVKIGESSSFPDTLPEDMNDTSQPGVLVILGSDPKSALQRVDVASYHAVLIELESECLGMVTGEDLGREGGKILGFARYRNGRQASTALAELVVQPNTDPSARKAAVDWLQSQGLTVAVCTDVPGRIVDHLMRPYFNQALNALDRRLASPEDLDQTLKMGLGYPRGPIELLSEGGLVHHFETSQALFAALGRNEYLPARRAQVAAARDESK